MSTLLAVILSCAPVKPVTEATTEAESRDTAYVIYDTASASTTEVDIDSLRVFLQEQINQLRSFNTGPVLDDIAQILAEGDESCPTYYTNGENPYWADQCTSSLGAEFQGYGTSIVYADLVQDDGSIASGQHYYGEGYVVGSDGRHLQIDGGVASTSSLGQDGTSFFSSYLDGRILDETSSDWLGWEYGPQFQLTGATNPESGLKIFWGVAEIETATTALFIDELVMVNDVYGQCALEPGAQLSLFTEQSGWLDLRFNGPTFETWSSDMTLCDGCGQLSQFGEDLGEICLDFSPLLDWDNSPFEQNSD